MNPRIFPTIVITAAFIISGLSAYPAFSREVNLPRLAGECNVPPHTKWTKPEKWVWEKICNGEIADFNIGKKYGGELDPKKNEIWNAENENAKKRVLRSRFLETILTHEPYKSALTRRGVCIVGAWFREKVDLSNANIDYELWLEKSRFDYGLDFNSLKTSNHVSFEGSVFKSTVDMDGIQVGKRLVMSEGAVFESEVILRGAKVGGQLAMVGSTFKGKVDMDSLEVSSSLFMNAAEIKKGKQTISDPAVFEGEVILRNAKVDGQLVMDGSMFKGKVNMNSLHVGSHLFMRNATFETDKEIDLLGSNIDGDLDISGSKEIPSIDLTGTTIKGEFCLGSEMYHPLKFRKGAKLTLRNAETGALQDLEKTWEGLKLELTGFTYKRLGGFTAGKKGGMATRSVDWMKGWLAKQEHYSPQPYKQLANILRDSGYKGKADDILYASRERAREESDGLKYLWLTFLKLTIGHGFRVYYLFVWVAGLTAIGAIVLKISGEGARHGMTFGLSYSLDMLLPIIKLREFHYTKDMWLMDWSRYYFYFHKVMGYVLVSVLIAGLTGITKK